MVKSDIRKEYIKKRNLLTNDEVSSLSENIFKNFITEFKPVSNHKIHSFLSITGKNEVNTRPFLNYFFENSIRVFVPKVVAGKMISIEIKADTPLIKNTWGIFEPESNNDSGEISFDFVLVPLLYADHLGNRVGYGKGFYDSFFTEINPQALKIGLNFFIPSEVIDNLREDDIPLDYLVTPTEVLSFGRTTSKPTK